ncbi:DUF4396 domain-containing protein [Rhodopseudomonas sp. B29]|uniref:DUF4396 domain-containing protein n=1 Tax=Rhodopseudomonas sp. B29 TaxID=95607 RepID=UPI0003478CBF|nr:DUF4396 domain-containing protein [Rhodopseudomonas sp. B29]
MIPSWLHILSIVSLALAVLCAAIIAIDEARHPQRMWIMNAVWPLTALFGSVLWTWGYFRYGRLSAADAEGRAGDKPFAIMVAEGASHCGSGCTLGDICAEWLAFAAPAVLVWLGWKTLFANKIFSAWILDYVFAYGFGIVFQYYTIAPMRKLGVAAGIWAAIKADTLSLTAWQIGMYGCMALTHFWLFRRVLGHELEVASPEFWFVMQIAMICGFITSYPVNWWLLRIGLKEKM